MLSALKPNLFKEQLYIDFATCQIVLIYKYFLSTLPLVLL